jgi:translation elongation factor EF-Tu-like GTPase
MFRMTVEDVFLIRNRGVVVFCKSIDEGKAGDNIAVLFKGIEKSQLDRGSVLTAAGEFPPIEDTGFVV